MAQIECLLCGSKNIKVEQRLYDKNFFPQEDFKFIKCFTCGLLFIHPLPTVEQIEAYYTQRYTEDFRDEVRLIKILNPYIMRVNQVKKFKKGGRIIDVGCGIGDFLSLMDDGNWEIYGVEISEPAAKIAEDKLPKHRIYTGGFLKVELPIDYFDVVTFWRVLDHLINPLGALRKVNRILKKGGLLFLEIPSASSFQRKIFGSAWYGYESARHLYRFAPNTIRKLLSSAGYKLIKINSSVNRLENFTWFKISLLKCLKAYSPYSTKYIKGWKGNLLWKMARSGLNSISFVIASILVLLGSGDNLFVVAEKIGN